MPPEGSKIHGFGGGRVWGPHPRVLYVIVMRDYLDGSSCHRGTSIRPRQLRSSVSHAKIHLCFGAYGKAGVFCFPTHSKSFESSLKRLRYRASCPHSTNVTNDTVILVFVTFKKINCYMIHSVTIMRKEGSTSPLVITRQMAVKRVTA